MELILLGLLGISVCVLILAEPKKFIPIFFLFKPTLDYFAEAGISVGGTYVSTTYITGTLIPLLCLLIFLRSKREFVKLPGFGLIVAFVVLNCASFIRVRYGDISTYGWILRVILPFLLYFSFPVIIESREDFIHFLSYVSYSGIFPLFMGGAQLTGLIPYNREAESLGTGTYMRITGGYDDSFSFAMPILISLWALIFLYNVTKSLNKLQVLLLILYPTILIFTYHRMIYILLPMTILISAIYMKFRKILITLISLIILLCSVSYTAIIDFYSDVSLVTHEYNISPAAFHGRGRVWNLLISKYNNYSITEKLAGKSLVGRFSHNDYLRILLQNGILGLSIYLILFAVLGFNLMKLGLEYSKPGSDGFMRSLFLLSLKIYLAYLLIGITLNVSLLSTFTWFLWISLGLLFYHHKIRPEEPESGTYLTDVVEAKTQ